MLIQEVLMNMKRGCLVALSALFAAAFFACSDSSNPGLPENDVSAVGNADDGSPVSKTVLPEEESVAGESSEQPVPESAEPAVQDDSADESGADESPAVGEEPISSSSAESSASLDSILDILFPDGIDIDTARHDPDSVGVWHFYDPRGTHDNPDFAYGEMTDPRDGNVYKTTTIGGQVWMAENLNYFDIEGAASSIKNDWCYWDKPENCESAGRLYTWKVAQRICPEGWRLPTNEDWAALLTAVGADTLNPIAWTGVNVLKSVSGWENGGSGTDDFGFTALPAGEKFFTKVQDGFTNHGCSAYMWSSTEADGGAADTLAFSLELNCSNELAIVNTIKKANGLSVRCVKE